MADRETWGISWAGNDKVHIYKSETNTRRGLFSRSINSSSNSKFVRMDHERFEFEQKRVNNNRSFSEEFSQDTYYRRIDGHNYSHPITEREEFDRLYEQAAEISKSATYGTVNPSKLIDNNLNDPLITHVDEPPNAILHSSRKGIFIGPDKQSPDSKLEPYRDRGCYTLFYDDRVEFVIGKESTDQVITLDNAGFVAAETSMGVLKHRVTLQHEEGIYHIWIRRSYDESDLESAIRSLTANSGNELLTTPIEKEINSENSAPNQTAGSSGSVLKDEEKSAGLDDFDPEKYDTNNKWWRRSILAVASPFLAFGSYIGGFAMLAVAIGKIPNPEMLEFLLLIPFVLLFLLSIPAAAIVFAICASGDKRYLAEETGHGRERHPLTILFAVMWSGGLYSIYYVIRRHQKFGS